MPWRWRCRCCGDEPGACRPLRPGGLLVIGDLMRPESPERASAMDLFYDLYFALTSRSGLWTFEEMAEWQRAAGLQPRKPMHLLMGQDLGQLPGACSQERCLGR